MKIVILILVLPFFISGLLVFFIHNPLYELLFFTIFMELSVILIIIAALFCPVCPEDKENEIRDKS